MHHDKNVWADSSLHEGTLGRSAAAHSKRLQTSTSEILNASSTSLFESRPRSPSLHSTRASGALKRAKERTKAAAERSRINHTMFPAQSSIVDRALAARKPKTLRRQLSKSTQKPMLHCVTAGTQAPLLTLETVSVASHSMSSIGKASSLSWREPQPAETASVRSAGQESMSTVASLEARKAKQRMTTLAGVRYWGGCTVVATTNASKGAVELEATKEKRRREALARVKWQGLLVLHSTLRGTSCKWRLPYT